MTLPKLNYDQIASEYNQRYPTEELSERGRALFELVQRFKNPRVLEVGVGTGHWLSALRGFTPHLFGLDFSAGMLQQARARGASLWLARGSAIRLPFDAMRFDLVYCVDAIHHFIDTRAFITEAFRVLKPNGALATFGYDPHSGRDEWYAYKYFDGALDTDLRRYESSADLRVMMSEAGFAQTETREVENILSLHHGRNVLSEPYIKKSSSSQLALLSDADYDAGIEKIKRDISAAESRGEALIFRSDLQVLMTMGMRL